MRAWKDVALLAKTRNLDGSFVVQSTAGLPFLLEEGMEVALVPPREDLPRRVRVASAEQLDRFSGCVRFDEVDDAAMARALVGSHCLVLRSGLPESALIAGGDDGIVGWHVLDLSEGLLGAVCGIIENPAQSLIEVERPDGRRLLIPLVDEFIVSVDEPAHQIMVEVPQGLTSI